jgi:hypothetical protein
MTRTLAFALLAALPFAAYALPGHADATMSIGNPIGVGGYTVRGPSTVTIAPTDRPGALAEVTFNNVSVNDAGDTGTTGTIDLDGLEVEVEFAWEVDVAGSDMVTITPPEGIICFPRCTITITEESQATIWLFSHEAVGF